MSILFFPLSAQGASGQGLLNSEDIGFLFSPSYPSVLISFCSWEHGAFPPQTLALPPVFFCFTIHMRTGW